MLATKLIVNADTNNALKIVSIINNFYTERRQKLYFRLRISNINLLATKWLKVKVDTNNDNIIVTLSCIIFMQ